MGNSSSLEESSQEIQPSTFRYRTTEFSHDNTAFDDTSLSTAHAQPETNNTGNSTAHNEPETTNTQIPNKKHTSTEQKEGEVTANEYVETTISKDGQDGEPIGQPNGHAGVSDTNNPDVVICTRTLDGETWAHELRQLSVKRHFSFGDKPRNYRNEQSNSDIPPIERFLLGRADVKKEGKKRPLKDILIAQVAPSNSSIYEEDSNKWKIPLQHFSSKKIDLKQDKKQTSKRIRSYYKAQNELITSYEDIQLDVHDEMVSMDIMKKLQNASMFLAKLSFGINLLLLIGKAAASVLSGSMSIISSLVDSSVDLLSGIILWWAARAAKTRDPYVYPQGRTKLEPVAVIIISVVMTVASLQLVRESIEKAIGLSNGSSFMPSIDITTFVIAGCTVVFKFVLWLMCRRVKTSAAQTLALDHRNDVASNLVAIVCGYLGSTGMYEYTKIFDLSYIDPVGAIIISFYIVYNWWKVGSAQIKLLTGHTAHPDFLSKLTWICMNHHKMISHIESVRAFHFGTNFLVEVDIVLPQNITLKHAHDIGEPLQRKLENLPEVERAFVHVDYDATHDPTMEHKIV